MRLAGVVLCSAALGVTACGGGDLMPSDAEMVARDVVMQESTAPFSCGVEFTVVNTLSDDVMATYGVPTQVDTQRVCGTWTGNDYRVHVETLGSSDNAGLVPDSTRTAMYSDGVTSGTDVTGAPSGAPTTVASSSFDLGQANANETAASYSDPYYAVASGGGGGGGGGGGDCISGCEMMTKRTALPANVAALVQMKDHGVKRGGVKELLGDKDEIAKGNNGHRRFHKVTGNLEEIIEIDPATELISAQEQRGPGHVIRATMKWKKQRNGRYIREQMDIEQTETADGAINRSRASVRILDLKMAGDK